MYNGDEGARTIPLIGVDKATFLFAKISEQHSHACTAALAATEFVLSDAGEEFIG